MGQNGLRRAGAVLLIASLAACGGGGGGGGNGGGGAGVAATFNAAFSRGDLLSYSLDTGSLTYTWTRIEGSQLPAGGSGSLVPVAGYGSYVYETSGGDTVVLLPNKLALIETAGGDLIAGVPQILTDYVPAAISGIYNYVRWDGDQQTFWIGTFEILANGTWWSVEGANLGDGALPDQTGTWLDLGNGVIEAFVDGDGDGKDYNVLLHPAGSESLLVIDDLQENGIILGVRQRPLPAVAGTFDVLDSSADALYTASVSGSTVTGPEGVQNYVLNAPWAGFAWFDSDGDMNAGTGENDFALMSPDGTFFGGGWEPPFGAGNEWVWAAIRH
jgi:hypothetical protein